MPINSRTDNKIINLHMKDYTVIGVNELLQLTVYTSLTNRILSEGSQKQKMTYYMIQFDLKFKKQEN